MPIGKVGNTTIVVGNPKPQSRTLGAAVRVARELTGADPDRVIDLAGFGPALLDWSDAAVAEAVEAVKESPLVVVASPTYKGTYTGLLKVFLDRFGAGSLNDTVAIPLMLGGHWKHALAPEAFLKPVLAELGASTPTAGLFLLDSQWDEPDALDDWLAVARPRIGVSSLR